MSCISDFFHSDKNKAHHSVYHAEFSKYESLHKNPLQTLENRSQIC